MFERSLSSYCRRWELLQIPELNLPSAQEQDWVRKTAEDSHETLVVHGKAITMFAVQFWLHFLTIDEIG